MKFVTVRLLLLAFICCLSLPLHAEIADPLDPFDTGLDQDSDSKEDESKTSDELIREASFLLDGDDASPLDARSKLILALRKDPKAYRAHLFLAGYYLNNVGHFRLALSYVKRAEDLFVEQRGQPPYKDVRFQFEHQNILYYLAHARLNLDNYPGALEVLDNFTKLGYYDDWYPGTRAWILMKLGKVPEAIKVAQIGYSVLSGDGEKGQILNMLGILLSMNHERANAIEIFKNAVSREYMLGSKGQPATPLNNMGEVYREIFDEDQAEVAFLKATSQRDGCQHVLPALNLASLYLDQLNILGAKKAIDNFESCIAQFPQKNGEEHRALVNLIRGRIDLYSGRADGAISHFESALERKQWFGKIGTSEGDLRAAALMSIAQAFTFRANQVKTTPVHGFTNYINNKIDALEFKLRAWWAMRRARQTLIEDLSNFEDLYIRSTDSMLEYPTLGTVSAGLPLKQFKSVITELQTTDNRRGAQVYYLAYLAENLLAHDHFGEANEILQKVMWGVRPKFDESLKLRTVLLRLPLYAERSVDYRQLAQVAFSLNRPALRNQGFRLPVNFVINEAAILDEFESTPFLLDNTQKLPYLIKADHNADAYVLQFSSETGVIGNIRVRSSDLGEAVRKLIDEVFVQSLKDEGQ